MFLWCTVNVCLFGVCCDFGCMVGLCLLFGCSVGIGCGCGYLSCLFVVFSADCLLVDLLWVVVV